MTLLKGGLTARKLPTSLFLFGMSPVYICRWFLYRERRGKPVRLLFSIGLLVLGLVFSAWLLPARQHIQGVQVSLGRGGMRASQIDSPLTNEKTCGQPGDVFRQLGFSVSNVPEKSVLSRLPTPRQKPVTRAGDMSYDPSKNELCTVGWQGIYTRYIQPSSANNNTGSVDAPSGSASTDWVQGILNGLFSSFAHTLSDFFSGVINWAKSFGFMFITPDALTYNEPVVSKLNGWAVDVVDSLLVLFLVVGGYNYMLGRNQLFRDLAPRLLFSGIASTCSLFFITQCIELHNALCLSFLGALSTAGVGDLSLPLGVLNWATAPVYEVLTYVIDLFMSVLLCVQMIVRLGLLDFLIVTAPFGWICFVIPQTVPWGRLWVQAFVSTLLLQFFQTVCIGLGSVLISSFGHSTYTVISILVGIATLYIAFKLPGMLLSNVLRASVGEVHRDVGRVARSAAEYAALAAT